MEGNHRNHRGWFRGSLTVEATFVVPILLGIVFAVMYLLFLFHDRVVLQENAYRALCSMAEDVLPVNDSIMRKEVEDALWMVQVKKVKVSQKHHTIIGEVQAQAKWDIPVMNVFLNQVQEIQWTQKLSCVHPEEVAVWRK